MRPTLKPNGTISIWLTAPDLTKTEARALGTQLLDMAGPADERCESCEDRGWLRIESGLRGSEIQACDCAAGRACGSDGDARNAYKAWLAAVKPEDMVCDESIRTPCSEAGADPCRCHCHMCAAYRAKLAAPSALRVFANPHFLERSYEHTNIVAVEGCRPPHNWAEVDRSKLDGLTKLWTQSGVTYWGFR